MRTSSIHRGAKAAVAQTPAFAAAPLRTCSSRQSEAHLGHWNEPCEKRAQSGAPQITSFNLRQPAIAPERWLWARSSFTCECHTHWIPDRPHKLPRAALSRSRFSCLAENRQRCFRFARWRCDVNATPTLFCRRGHDEQNGVVASHHLL